MDLLNIFTQDERASTPSYWAPLRDHQITPTLAANKIACPHGIALVHCVLFKAIYHSNYLVDIPRLPKKKVTKLTQASKQGTRTLYYIRRYFPEPAILYRFDQLQSTHATDRPFPPRMRHPPIMRDANPPIMTVDTRVRSTQQFGSHSVWDQECAGKTKRVAKRETAENATKSIRCRLV